jgi:hypothetical protein
MEHHGTTRLRFSLELLEVSFTQHSTREQTLTSVWIYTQKPLKSCAYALQEVGIQLVLRCRFWHTERTPLMLASNEISKGAE